MGSTWVSEAECIRLIGEEKARIFIKIFGGIDVYIPKLPQQGHLIAQELGIIAMAKLCREFGTFCIQIPSHVERQSKKTYVVELLEQGKTTSEVALLAGVSTRYVRMIKSAA